MGTILTYDEEKKQSKMIFPKDMIATLSSETILQVMEGYDKICVKPTVDTCSRVGVNLFDISNNVWECQIRRLAKYRNNSYFVGSPESGVHFACLMSHFAISESTIWILWSIFVMCSAGSRKRQRTNW